MNNLKAKVDRILECFCIILMSVMTLLVTYQVILRYIFNNPSVVSEILAKYLFIWMIFMCASYVFGLRDHMNIPFIKDNLKPRIKIFVELICEFSIAAFTICVMVYGGYYGAMRQMSQLDSALQIPVSIIYCAIPVSGLFTLFYFVYNSQKLIKEYKKDKEEK